MISFLDLVGKCFTILLLRKKPTICLNQPHTNPSLQSTSFCCLIARSPGGRDSRHVVVGDLIQAAFHNPVSSRQLMLSRTFGSLTLQLERQPQRPAPWNSQKTLPWVNWSSGQSHSQKSFLEASKHYQNAVVSSTYLPCIILVSLLSLLWMSGSAPWLTIIITPCRASY